MNKLIYEKSEIWLNLKNKIIILKTKLFKLYHLRKKLK